MVEYNLTMDDSPLDSVFGSLADPIRRDILRRVAGRELSVNEVAEPYAVSLAAVSKHLKVLERARLIVKRRQGRQQFVQLAPDALAEAADHLDFYKTLAIQRFDALERLLDEEQI
jgi:DNA-binding transcriptional ArsR family regulator